MKKLMSVILTIILLSTAFVVPTLAADSQNNYLSLQLDKKQTVSISEGGEIAYFSFVPQENGLYRFQSYSDLDTYGCLFDSQMNEIASNDDSTSKENGDFRIDYQLKAGYTYYLSAEFYSNIRTGEFPIMVTMPTYVTSIDFEDLTINEFTYGYYTRDDLDNMVYLYSDWYWAIPSVSITMSDGNVYKCYFDETNSDLSFYFNGRWYYPEISEGDCYWETGNTYTKNISVMGFSDDINISIVGANANNIDTSNRIESIEVEPITMYTDEAYGRYDYNYHVYYNHYDWYEKLELILNFTDGSSVLVDDIYHNFYNTGYEYYFTYSTRASSYRYCYFNIDDQQNYENQWQAGNTYTINMEIEGISTSVNVTIASREKKKVDGINYYISNGEATVYDCDSSTTGAIEIPTEIDGSPVTSIGNGAFKSAGITSIILPNTVTKIGIEAFYSCRNLTNITIPNSVTYIGDDAFYKCDSLVTVTIPDSVTYLGGSAFSRCHSLKKVKLGNGIAAINNSTFYNCYDINDINIPNSVTYIGNYAFDGCDDIQKIVIPNNVNYIGDYAFFICEKLEQVVLPNGSISIGSYAFDSCKNLKEVYYNKGNKVETGEITVNIGDRAFLYCEKLKTVKLPGTANIGCDAFNHCTQLKRVIAQDGFATVATRAFYYCKSLFEVSVPKNNKDISVIENGWYSKDGTKLVKYYLDTGDNTCTITQGVKNIGYMAFEGRESLKSITIPNSVKYIEDNAFLNCNNITDVYFTGSIFEKGEILSGRGNEALFNAKWHYLCEGECEHIYDNACDADCNGCYDTREITHDYKWVVDKAAKCGADGVKHEECTICHTKRNVNTPIAATGNHKYNTGKVTKGATCKEAGIKTHTCTTTGCKATKTSTIAKLTTHTYKTTTTKATTSKNGSIVKKCTVCSKIASRTTIKYAKSFKLSTTTYTYSGKAKTPTVTVKDSTGKKLVKNKDYTVSYKNNKNVGKATVTITLKGKYTGTKTLTFKINPKKTSVSKLTAAKKSLKVKITKQSSQVTGYEIQYSSSKTFKAKYTKTKKVTSYKTTSVTLKSLKAKKTYYVRVRTYKTVGKTKYYSGWSTYKSKKTK